MGELPSAFPTFLIPNVPLNLETLGVILPVAVTMTVVGLLESLLTASIVDDLTDTRSDKNTETRGQGIANIASGLFGGMAGCAMIGQSVINVKSGGRGRLSALTAGTVLLFLILVLQDWVVRIPMAALVAVMIMVSIGTFNWGSLRQLRTMPVSSSIVMIATTLTVVFSHDLSKGVLVGVLLSALFFARKVAHFVAVESVLTEDGRCRTYKIYGQLFFASADALIAEFDFQESLDRVEIDLTSAHLWDYTAVGAIDKIVLRFRREGADVNLIGLNQPSTTLLDRLGVHDKPDAAGHQGVH